MAWKNCCLFSLDAVDATIKTLARGGYGHSATALGRQQTTLTPSIMENGVTDLLDKVLRDGSL